MALMQAFAGFEQNSYHLDDPFDWTVDQVVFHLCSPKSAILSWGGGVYLPDPGGFEKALREEQINGETLLTTVSMQILRNDLGIKALGARSKIFNLISELQHVSSKYQQTLERKAVSESRISSAVPMSRYQTPQLTSPLFTTLRLTHHQPAKRIQPGQTPLSPSSLPSAADTSPVVETSRKTDGKAANVPKFLATDVTNQPQESSSIDGDGRRRRRLAPTIVTGASSSVHPPVSADVNNDEPLQDPQTSIVDNSEDIFGQANGHLSRLSPIGEEVPEQTTLGDQNLNGVSTLDGISTHPLSEEDHFDRRHRKRIKPTPVEKTPVDHLREASPLTITSASQDQVAETLKTISDVRKPVLGRKSKREVHQIYYDPSAFHVDELFYSDIALGEFGPDEAQFLTTEEQEMSFNSTKQLPGAQRLWVNTRMKHFFNISMTSKLIFKEDRREIGIIPYPDRLGKKHHPLSMTVLSRSENGITKLRANRLNWTAKASARETSNFFKVSDSSTVVTCDDGNWDALEKWNHVHGDEVLPVYGESDSEDYDSETYAEMEAERREIKKPAASSKTRLTAELVEAAIDDAVRQFCEEWQTKKLPKLQYKAWRIWTKASRDGTADSQIVNTIHRLTNLEHRILNLQTEISKEEWFSINEILKQSKSIQPSVFEREEYQWRLSILQSKSTPEKLPAPARKVRETNLDKDSVQQEEKTDMSQSSADDELSDSDLDDFIVDDELEGSEFPLVPQNEDVRMADDQDVGLSDTLLNSPFTPTAEWKEQSQHKLSLSTAQAEPTQTQTNFIDLTQASDSPASPPPRKVPTRIATPPIFDEEEDSDAWFQRTRSTKPEFKHPPKIEDTPVVYLDVDSDPQQLLRAPVTPVNLPPLSDVDAIGELDPTKLVEKQDRKRLLIWYIAHTRESKRQWILEYVHRVDIETCLKRVKFGIREMKAGKLLMAKKDLKFSEGIMQIAAWYIGWTIPVAMDSKGVNVNHIDITQENDEGFDTFHDFMLECLQHYDQSTSAASKSSECVQKGKARAEDLSDSAEAQVTPSKRNKKGKASEKDLSDTSTSARSPPNNQSKSENADDEDLSDSLALADLRNTVPESQETLQKRDAALQRMRDDTLRVQLRAERDARQKVLMSRLAGLVEQQTEPFEVILNPGKLDDCDLIRLNPEFGRGAHLKPHQKEGLQFMWREITGDHRDLQGCLLAQTMGLGKTMQVIALLVAISDAVHSPSQRIRDQVPVELHSCQTLVLVPPALIENWWDEFLMWPPASNHLGELRKVSASLTRDERISEILAWEQEGGILLMGYTTFRDLIQNRPRLSKINKAAGTTGHSPLNEEQHREIKAALLEKPNIVVADEAHEFKNLKSNISQAINRIKCKSRIALTGSPLSNNLGEYFATIDWISPGYLGTESDFKSVYEIPIQHGLHEDASREQYRDSRKRLKALELELEPKVHRADLSALHGNLHGKSEFVVRVPLTAFQDRLYRDVVSGYTGLSEDIGPAKGATVWTYLATLQLICNHPASCGKEQKVSEKNKSADSLAKTDNEAGVSRKQSKTMLDDDNEVSRSNSDEDPIMDKPLTEDILSIVLGTTQKAFGDLRESKDALDLSNKMQALMRIIELSGAAGDKVLVFSHRHGTLDYIEDQLKKLKKTFSRIDGTTKTQKRQKITKTFNEGPDEVCLISTRAGGQGLNLFGANRVVILDFHFNPMWEQQAIGRAYRIGQQKPVYIYRLTAAGTFEEEIQSQALFKETLATRVLEKKNPHRIGVSGARQYVFAPRESPRRDVTCFAGKDPSVLDHLLADKRTPILSITPSETYHVDDGQDLTAQEQKEAQQMLELERLRRRNPAQYHARLYSSSGNRSTQISGEPSNWKHNSQPTQSRVQQAVPPKPHISTTPHVDVKTTVAQLVPAISALFSFKSESPTMKQVPSVILKAARKDILRVLMQRGLSQASAWVLAGKFRDSIAGHVKHNQRFQHICQGIGRLIEDKEVDPNTLLQATVDFWSHAGNGKGREAANPIDLDGDGESQAQPRKAEASEVPMLVEGPKENAPLAVLGDNAAAKTTVPTLVLRPQPPQENRATAKVQGLTTPPRLVLRRQSPQENHATPSTTSTKSGQETSAVKQPREEETEDNPTTPKTTSTKPREETSAGKRAREEAIEGTDDVSPSKKQKPSSTVRSVGQKFAKNVRG